jgi:hypothetical protein
MCHIHPFTWDDDHRGTAVKVYKAPGIWYVPKTKSVPSGCEWRLSMLESVFERAESDLEKEPTWYIAYKQKS